MAINIRGKERIGGGKNAEGEREKSDLIESLCQERLKVGNLSLPYK